MATPDSRDLEAVMASESSRHRVLGERQEHAGDDVVEHQDEHDRVHHCLGDTATDAAGPTQGVEPLIATDHAPHTIEEKEGKYLKAPSGGPLVQHSLVAMLEFVKQGKITLERAVEKISHAPALCLQVEKRGFIRKGYFADLVMVDLNDAWTVNKSNLLYHCGWSPFEGYTFSSKVLTTWVNGKVVYKNGSVVNGAKGSALTYSR